MWGAPQGYIFLHVQKKAIHMAKNLHNGREKESTHVYLQQLIADGFRKYAPPSWQGEVAEGSRIARDINWVDRKVNAQQGEARAY